jgi:hypothetical protein
MLYYTPETMIKWCWQSSRVQRVRSPQALLHHTHPHEPTEFNTPNLPNPLNLNPWFKMPINESLIPLDPPRASTSPQKAMRCDDQSTSLLQPPNHSNPRWHLVAELRINIFFYASQSIDRWLYSDLYFTDIVFSRNEYLLADFPFSQSSNTSLLHRWTTSLLFPAGKAAQLVVTLSGRMTDKFDTRQAYNGIKDGLRALHELHE